MTAKNQAYNIIKDLVQRFEEQFDSYKQAEYNETLTRRDFIDPFFKALGWDVDNSQGFAEAYREVIHEDRVRVGKATKAPDYSFQLAGGKRLFFVEAKKPSVAIKDDISVAYQIRRYGWSAKLAVSIITDFEEFAVYDCTKKPKPTDKTGVARIKYLNFKDYLSEFDYLWNTFSKEQVLKGSFDRYIKSDTLRKGTATVDKEFLASLDTWRTYLATSISLKNKELDEEEINFAVQLIIDRLIFLRIAEDRGVENYGQLKTSVNQKGDSYKNLFYNFKQADEKYNSGLFDFKKDAISEKLNIENKVIKTIINEMYYPESPYEFSVISVEILGSAYEQFLGKVIRITPSHHAIIEEKPEVRKAGGVFYTPQYIVDYIVESTVGKLIEGKSPKQISKFKILDPACGSGSFLIGAYQYLLNYHKNYYTENGTKTGKKESPVTPQGNLTSAEKKRILLNNIYGVDIDVNAVEVTKLSLLLKCMEGETATTIMQQQKLWHERILPTLEENVKVGNSLISPDIYDQMLELGFEKKIKPFDWKTAFPEVFKPSEPDLQQELKAQFLRIKHQTEQAEKNAKILIDRLSSEAKEPDIYYGNGGFDAVIGNPPYLGGREWKEENGNAYDYFIRNYRVAEYQFDIYALFWERAIKLLNSNGFVGYITPNTWLNNQSNTKLRSYILKNAQVLKIVDYSKVRVFDQATVLPIITILQKTKLREEQTEIFEPIGDELILKNYVSQEIWEDGNLNIFNIDLNESDVNLREKIEKDCVELGEIALVKRGIQLYETGKGIPKQKAEDAKNNIYESNVKVDDSYIKFLEGKDIFCFSHIWKNRWIKYGKNLAARRDPILFEGERIAVRRIVGKTLISTYFFEKIGISQLLHIVKPHNPSLSKYLLGILNSKLMAFYFRKKYNRQDKTFPEIRIYELASLPIKIVDTKNPTSKKLMDDIIWCVDILLQANSELLVARLPDKKEQLKTRITFTENKINQIVYEIYGLNDAEIKMVEG
ncbi:Eco57I restriction-modification methylase domain-containing protein [Draconibacterium sp.]|jgi:type I restriction-modification system DNA methylase subunit